MNKKVTIIIKDKKFDFRHKFVWRQGFHLYLSIDEIESGEISIKNTGFISNINCSSAQDEYSSYKDDYKKAVEKYKKLKMFM
jgi:hypothetical protein